MAPHPLFDAALGARVGCQIEIAPEEVALLLARVREADRDDREGNRDDWVDVRSFERARTPASTRKDRANRSRPVCWLDRVVLRPPSSLSCPLLLRVTERISARRATSVAGDDRFGRRACLELRLGGSGSRHSRSTSSSIGAAGCCRSQSRCSRDSPASWRSGFRLLRIERGKAHGASASTEPWCMARFQTTSLASTAPSLVAR